MQLVDWLVVIAYIGWIVIDGLRRSKGTDKVDGYFLANRSLPWWAVGLSVMATQMSAVTIVGTTGLGYLSGLRFVQFYFGLPLAMVILSLTVVPFFTRARVYTAYEYLERRFDVGVRSLASCLFLVGRAASLGVTLAAPAVVMSAILGWTLPVTVLVICVPMIVYTTLGGVHAGAWSGRRNGPAERRRLLDQPERTLHLLVRHDRRALSDAVVFRLRSEPGAALSHGEVDRRSAPVAADERVRQDSAAAADSGQRRAGVRLLSVPALADALQSRLRRAGAGGSARGGIHGARTRLRDRGRHQARGRDPRRSRRLSGQRRARQR